MQTSQLSPESGFTLMEMLVVLAIMGLVAVVFITRPAGNDNASNRDVTTRLKAELQMLRQSAIVQKKIISFAHGQEGLDYQTAISSHQQLRFYPDGSSNGGKLSRDGLAIVTIDWRSGAIVDAR